MLLLTLTKREAGPRHIRVFGKQLSLSDIEATPNMSWRVNSDLAKYFTGVTLGEKMIATSGMTVGKNALFLRQIANGRILEPYRFRFTEEPITLERELARARLGKIAARQGQRIKEQQASGTTRKVVAWTAFAHPRRFNSPTTTTGSITRHARGFSMLSRSG